jgi:hypothetical protein
MDFTANTCDVNSHLLCWMPAFIPDYLSPSWSNKSRQVNCKAPCSVLKISKKTMLWVQVERDEEVERNYTLYHG